MTDMKGWECWNPWHWCVTHFLTLLLLRGWFSLSRSFILTVAVCVARTGRSIGTVPLWTDQFINDTFKGGVHHSLYYESATKKQTKTTGPSFPVSLALPPQLHFIVHP